MKIYKNNKVYVTRKDIVYLLKTQQEVPNSIKLDVITQNGNSSDLVCNKMNKNDFFVFESDEAKEYFSKFDFILNYGSYIHYDLDYLDELFNQKASKRMMLNDYYNEMDEQEKMIHQGLKNYINNLDLFLEGLMDIVDLKKNESTIVIPKREPSKAFLEKEERAKEFLIKMIQPIRFY